MEEMESSIWHKLFLREVARSDHYQNVMIAQWLLISGMTGVIVWLLR